MGLAGYNSDTERGHTGKTKAALFERVAFVLKTELLQFRTGVPSGAIIFVPYQHKNKRARGESS